MNAEEDRDNRNDRRDRQDRSERHSRQDSEDRVDRAQRQERQDEDLKAAVKEAIKEWLDEKILQFGKWSLGIVVCAALAALVYFIMTMNGWRQP